MAKQTYRAQDVAHFFLGSTDPEDSDISNLKLQKLCYYAQGILSAARGAPLFSDRIEAWDHGPVVPALYHEYKANGATPIPACQEFDASIFDAADTRGLRDILEYYGQFAPWRLRNMTHDEAPWVKAYNQEDREITCESMAEHFRPLVEDSYIDQVYGREVRNKAAEA